MNNTPKSIKIVTDERGNIMQTDFSKIKCIGLDLDDTMLNSDKTLTSRTKAALTAALDKGIAIIPISGRSYATIPACVRKLEGISHAVTSNGAAIYDFNTGARIHEWLLEPKDVRSIMRSVGNFFLEGQITYEAFVDGVAYASADYVMQPANFGVPASAVSYVQQTRHPNRFIIDFIFDNAKKMDSLDLILKDAGLYRMIENTIKRTTDSVYITSSVPYRMEISSKDSGKTAGLKYVLDLLQISPEETLVFGDGDNDAEMIHFAGIGVAMKNATESCKENADFVTDYTNNEDGVAEFIEKNILN